MKKQHPFFPLSNTPIAGDFGGFVNYFITLMIALLNGFTHQNLGETIFFDALFFGESLEVTKVSKSKVV